MKQFIYSLLLLLPLLIVKVEAQKPANNLIYVDKQGVMRYSNTKAEASFFGVNYTVPFAYGYRSVKRMGIDIEKAIDQDVYHFSRLGLNAFRVHVWDTEITDTAGNLLENDQLRLFDYLIFKLKERKIKILITPIAFWGSGYPERDEKTPGFSHKYGKQKALVNDTAIKAQENYLIQFFKHVNPYTKLTYGNDPDVIAMEINNEPHHSGPREKVTEYVNRMAAAVKSTGWTKPVFYNISESPAYAGAVAKANIDGVSFQWYPTGLVANRTLQGNYLANVDVYKIPFGDTIPQYHNKARMVYEFDAGDVLQSTMYPAMARSFRTAGFQWATQFAYDPMATAYANTEYQTHYLNLAYTPSKAISFLIASKVFHKVPRLQPYGTYPADNSFDVFRISYKNSLSEMNSEEEFYYSNSTTTKPVNPGKLKHIAGVGSSPVVSYKGMGAYFVDNVGDGSWRLEVMPDAIVVSDPFAKASPKKEVVKINWQANQMQVNLTSLGLDFIIKGLNEGNSTFVTATGNQFYISPGTYVLQNKNKAQTDKPVNNEFIAPKTSVTEPQLVHSPFNEVSGGTPFFITAKLIGVDSSARVNIEVRNSSNTWKTVSMQKHSAYDFIGELPAELVVPGVINYRIIVQDKSNTYIVFPGNYQGNPYAWDAHHNQTWETYVTSKNSPVEIFNPNTDRSSLNLYNPDWRNNTIKYITAGNPRQLVLQATMSKPTGNNIMGWQYYFAEKISGRKSSLPLMDKVVVKGWSDKPTKLKVAFITADGESFAANIILTEKTGEIEIPLTAFTQDSALLLPRPYPGFLPLWFKANGAKNFTLADAEKLEITFGHQLISSQLSQPLSIEIESVSLKESTQ